MVTRERLGELLAEADIRCLSDGATLMAPFVHNNRQMFNVFVDLDEEDGAGGYGFVRFRIPYLASAANPTHRAAALEKAMHWNMQWKLAKLCLDPADGEISAEVGLPVGDGEPTAQQVGRCVAMLMCHVMEHQAALQQIADTGVDPDQAMEESLEKLFADWPDEAAASGTLFNEDADQPVGERERGAGE